MRTRFLAVLVTAVAVAGCASLEGPKAPPSVNVSGNWVGTWQYDYVQNGSGEVRGTFQQDGAKLSGNFNVTGPVLNRTANVAGVVSGNDIYLTMPASGNLTVNGNVITGTINGLDVAKVTLRKQ
jgi:hypothetical protein